MNLGKIPYLGLFAAGGDSRGRPLLTRVAENAIPGILVAILSVYINDAKQDTRLQAMERAAEKIQVRADSLGGWVTDNSIILATQAVRLDAVEAALERQRATYTSLQGTK